MAAEKARLNDPFAPEGGGVATEVVIVDVQPSSTVQQEGCKLHNILLYTSLLTIPLITFDT